jgi:hypothetical protein
MVVDMGKVLDVGFNGKELSKSRLHFFAGSDFMPGLKRQVFSTSDATS